MVLNWNVYTKMFIVLELKGNYHMSQHKLILSMFNNVTTAYLSNRSKLIEFIKISGLAKSSDPDHKKHYENYNSLQGLNLDVAPDQYADYLIHISTLGINSYVEYNKYAGNFIFTYLFLNKFKKLQSATLVSNLNFDLSWVDKSIVCSKDHSILRTADLTYICADMPEAQTIYNNSVSINYVIPNINANPNWALMRGSKYLEFNSKEFIKSNINFGIGIITKPRIEQIEKKNEFKIDFTATQGIPGLVSIVIPCYNSSKYMTNTLNSIKDQSYNYYEIIVVDDGSEKSETEHLRNIVNQFDGEIKYFENSNHGACHARNFGAGYASGEYILFCDSDVILDKNYLMKTIQALQSNSKASWAYCNFSVGVVKNKFFPFDAKKLKKSNFCSTMSLVKSVHFVGFNETLKRLQDWEMFYRMSKLGLIGTWVNEFLFFAEDRPGITRSSINWKAAICDFRKLHPEIG